ncbi:MAG: arginine--tRNA ligase [Bacteroidales bacterium]|nr:arginine--tRNA ligase [Bacteroidales bacterium]
MNLGSIIATSTIKGFETIYGIRPGNELIQLQKTKKEFTGDITLVVFPLLKISKQGPEKTGEAIGAYLCENVNEVTGYNVIKGFLNLTISDAFYIDYLNEAMKTTGYGMVAQPADPPVYMVEYSSPNTNKPLHLGHIRNNLLGYALSEILKANGRKVIKTNIVNDRGIHICKSMLAWQKWGNGETPSNTIITYRKKGDHLVGDYYVMFENEYKKQVKQLMNEGQIEEEALRNAPLIREAQELLIRWEKGDPEVYQLWQTMNQWVYEGFEMTYQRLGVDFDKIYYESDTYVVGKETVLEGVKKKIFIREPDGSVWSDLTGDGLDKKILLRSDGTSVYMTQDIGTAQLRQNDYAPDKMIYVVGNEQEYHFRVLALILDKLGFEWAKDLYHLSYGMVGLPDGKMKSREGTVVDADDLLDEMTDTAREMSKELGKLEGLNNDEKEDIFRIIGLGALKYFILKVDPVKNMTFDPKESIDFNGNTGPFIQYTHARIRSVFRKAGEMGIKEAGRSNNSISLNEKEKTLLKLVYEYPAVVKDAGSQYNPALLANYAFELAKEYNQFYHDYPILRDENQLRRDFRLMMSDMTGRIIKSAMGLLGIDVPDRM